MQPQDTGYNTGTDRGPKVQETPPVESGKAISSYYYHARPEVLERIPLTARCVLDVGCGAGGLSFNLKRRQNVVVHGVELISTAAEHARTHLDKVWNSTIEDALPELPDSYYDCIVVADVLEHLIDPWTALNTLKEKLAAGGKIVASIPNIQNWGVLASLIEGEWNYMREGILDRTHLRFFTRKSVEELFWNAGLRITCLTQKNGGPVPPAPLLQRFRDQGFLVESLERDGPVYQFLIEADCPAQIDPPKTIIVILNWNGKDDTLDCLASASKINYPNFEIAVVDNGSTDDSVEAISENFPGVFILQTGANLGYSGGNNVGIKWALDRHADYVLLLNNDTTVDPGLINAFVDAAQRRPDAGALSARIYFHAEPDRLWYAGAKWVPDLSRFTHLGWGKRDDEGNFSTECNTDYASGCVFFASSMRWREIGLLDDNFFLTFEETDWCYRARQMGYPSVYVPSAKVWHKVSVSFGGAESPLAQYFMTRNRLLWAKRHLGIQARYKLWGDLAREVLPHWGFNRTPGVGLVRRLWWSIAEGKRIWNQQLADPIFRAQYLGIRDFLLGRFGHQPNTLKKLKRT